MQYFLEDSSALAELREAHDDVANIGSALAELREAHDDVANIGGVHEPKLPALREVLPPHARPVTKVKALEDVSSLQNQSAAVPQHFDIGTPSHAGSLSEEQVPDGLSPPNCELEEGTAIEHEDLMVGWTCATLPPTDPCRCSLDSEVFVLSEDAEPAELVFRQPMSHYLVHPKLSNSSLSPDHEIVFNYHAEGEEGDAPVIQRAHNILTREEALANAEACKVSMLKELNRWNKHKAWKRMP